MSVELDELDRKILRLVQEDSSRSLADIAKAVNLSTSPCWRRLKRLRDEGVIRGEVALLDAGKLGLSITVFATITLNHHSKENVAALERLVNEAPEVMECHAVTGDRDYLLRIVVADIEAYDRFMATRLLDQPAIASVNSRFALHQVKYQTALPLRA